MNTKIGRNAPCPCGSGTKHKKCCGLTSSPFPFNVVAPLAVAPEHAECPVCASGMLGGYALPTTAPEIVHVFVVFKVVDPFAIRRSLDGAGAQGFVRRGTKWVHLPAADGEDDFTVFLSDGLLMLESWCEATAEEGRRMVESIVGRAARYLDTDVIEMWAVGGAAGEGAKGGCAVMHA
jgi:hypothetical protein